MNRRKFMLASLVASVGMMVSKTFGVIIPKAQSEPSPNGVVFVKIICPYFESGYYHGELIDKKQPCVALAINEQSEEMKKLHIWPTPDGHHAAGFFTGNSINGQPIVAFSDRGFESCG